MSASRPEDSDDPMQTTRAEYKAKMVSQIAEWTERLDVLDAEVRAAGASARSDLRARLADLRGIELEAQELVARLDATAEDSWNAARSSVIDAWNRMVGTADAVWDALKR